MHSLQRKDQNKAWKLAPLYIFWTTWKERNKMSSSNKVLAIQSLKNVFLLIFGNNLTRATIINKKFW